MTKVKNIDELTPEELKANLVKLQEENAKQKQTIAEAEAENEKIQKELHAAELNKGEAVVKTYKNKVVKFKAAKFILPGDEPVTIIAQELENDSEIIGQLIKGKSGLIEILEENK